MDNIADYYMAEENIEGLREMLLFHLVSPGLQISLVGSPGWCSAFV